MKEKAIWNICKNIFLGLFGVVAITELLIVASHFDETLQKNGFMHAYLTITWSIYIAFKTFSEYKKLNDE